MVSLKFDSRAVIQDAAPARRIALLFFCIATTTTALRPTRRRDLFAVDGRDLLEVGLRGDGRPARDSRGDGALDAVPGAPLHARASGR